MLDYIDFVTRLPGAPGLLSSLSAYARPPDADLLFWESSTKTRLEDIAEFQHCETDGEIVQWEDWLHTQDCRNCRQCLSQIVDEPCVILPARRLICLPCYCRDRMLFLARYAQLAHQLMNIECPDLVGLLGTYVRRVCCTLDESITLSFGSRNGTPLWRAVQMHMHHSHRFSLVVTLSTVEYALVVDPSTHRTLKRYRRTVNDCDASWCAMNTYNPNRETWLESLFSIHIFCDAHHPTYLPYDVTTH